MTSTFRFDPPEARPGALTRPRLLRAVLGRWDHRVTSVVGGPGLGKTTLLAQAIAENRLAPRGEDIWIGIGKDDADGDTLSRTVFRAVHPDSAPDSGEVDPSAVADAIWQRSPTELCLIFDDVHLLSPGSGGANWLSAFVDALPANGHVVLASRSEPPVPLARLGTQGAVLRLDEDDLRFSEDELQDFAARRGVPSNRFVNTGGWPAMVELAASVSRPQPRTGAYLWEEVLEPLGKARRHVLAVLCDLGGADDALATAAVGRPVRLSTALDSVPLVAVGADGWYRPHALWRTAPGLGLSPAERAETRRRAVRHLRERNRFDDAFGLLQEAELWDEAPAVLRDACLTGERWLGPKQLDRWLASCPESVRETPAGRLAAGLHTALTAPADAVEPLRRAALLCREAGDVDGELAAIAQLGRLVWLRQDLSAFGGELAMRVFELEAQGHPTARGLAALGRATVADLRGDDAAVLAELGTIEPGTLDPLWEAFAGWLSGVVRLDLGDAAAALDITEHHMPSADPALRTILDSLRLRSWWALGRVDEVLQETPIVLADLRAKGVAPNRYMGLTNASLVLSQAGDVEAAQRYLDEAVSLRAAPASRGGGPHVRTALALASLRLAQGDEEQATRLLEEAIENHGLDQGVDRRGWRQTLSLTYVLVPSTREHWDRRNLRGHLRVARELAAAVVAVRSGHDDEVLRRLELPDLSLVRSALHFRFAADLAVALAARGRPQGPALLEAIGPVGPAAVRTLSAARSPNAKQAKSLLAAVPAPPPQVSWLAVLGPLVLRRSNNGDQAVGEVVSDPELRRKRLRALLAFLVSHRTTTRAAITAALWPDLDERTASKNLAVTLTYLLRVLEPWRAAGEPAFLLRVDGPSVKLVTGPHLRVDTDEFDQHVAAASRAEADGTPSVALEHHLAAANLYRGNLYLDMTDDDWIALDREHYRAQFVSAATRAGQLLLGRGDPEQAEAVARRVLTVDPWAEDAYAVVVAAALATGDRSTARRTLEHCVTALADLGVEPSPATRQLHRRVRGNQSVA